MTNPASASVPLDRRKVWSWALYDWANSAFATTVMVAFFPVFYKSYLRGGVEDAVSSKELLIAISISGILIALSAPFLGAIADRGGAKKRLLAVFASLGVLTTALLGFSSPAFGLVALVVFVLANIGFSGANIFYDSLLPAVAPDEKSDSVSAFGFALGYLGGGVLFAVNVVMLSMHEKLGIEQETATKLSFLSVAAWWALFSIPLFKGVPEPEVSGGKVPMRDAARAGWLQLKQTLAHIMRVKNVFLFLIAYLLYIDGVNTVMKTATTIGTSIGIGAPDMMKAILMIQFIGFPAAIAFGYLGEKIGTRKGILIAIGVYGLIVIGASQLRENWHFYALAAGVGLVQGGVQSLSRSYFSRIIPAGKAGEFFGFYNMLGKFATVFGPILISLGLVIAGRAGLEGPDATRAAMPSLLILFVAGGVLLWKVRDPDAKPSPAEDGEAVA